MIYAAVLVASVLDENGKLPAAVRFINRLVTTLVAILCLLSVGLAALCWSEFRVDHTMSYLIGIGGSAVAILAGWLIRKIVWFLVPAPDQVAVIACRQGPQTNPLRGYRLPATTVTSEKSTVSIPVDGPAGDDEIRGSVRREPTLPPEWVG